MLNVSQVRICAKALILIIEEIAMRNFHAITFLVCHVSDLILFLSPILLYKRPSKRLRKLCVRESVKAAAWIVI